MKEMQLNSAQNDGEKNRCNKGLSKIQLLCIILSNYARSAYYLGTFQKFFFVENAINMPIIYDFFSPVYFNRHSGGAALVVVSKGMYYNGLTCSVSALTAALFPGTLQMPTMSRPLSSTILQQVRTKSGTHSRSGHIGQSSKGTPVIL